MSQEEYEYECEIAVCVKASSPEEAVRAAQDIIDCNVERWVFDVRNLETGETFVVAAS